MSKALRLYNSFTRTINDVNINGRPVLFNRIADPTNASFYICGPTVYSHSHLGHAITYIRADLFRRFMKSIFNVNLTTVMNITDIDDKILAKANSEGTLTRRTRNNHDDKYSDDGVASNQEHYFKTISDRYYRSFLKDMNYIRVKPPDISVKVSQQIDLIMRYIQKLELDGHAYIGNNGDIYFKVESLANYVGRIDERKEADNSSLDQYKQDPRDFVLWKAAKPNEPIWLYKSRVTDKLVPGRPGWHVQCSAISSAIFGNKLDFHFGGKDLIFPHHYNEQACCCAYHNLDTSKSLHVWANNWLHSGHLILRDEKMSKSIGNVLKVEDFINSTSINALRLICIESHYRADVNYNEDLLRNMRLLDHKLSAFCNYLSSQLQRTSELNLTDMDSTSVDAANIDKSIQRVHEEIISGVCDDFDLERGLRSLVDLSKEVYSIGLDNLQPRDVVSLWHLLTEWCRICGLEYGPTQPTCNDNLVAIIREFRETIRSLTVSELKRVKELSDSTEEITYLTTVLKNCDKVRTQLDEMGFVSRDKKS